MEDALGFIPFVFIILWKLIIKKIKYEINAPYSILRIYLGVEILLAIGLFILIFSHNNGIRIFGFEGNKNYFCFAYFSLLLVYPIIKKSKLSEIEKSISKILTGVPVFFSLFALIPWVGLVMWSFFIRLTGSDREIFFETERYRLERIEYSVMSGGRYDFYIVEKEPNSKKEKILKEVYRHPDEFKGINGLFKKERTFYFSKGNEKGLIDTFHLTN